jgi:ADP-ribosylglycohydrolase
VRGALWGVFIADALSMPAHWYYDPAALARDFGAIRGYEAPRKHHPSSIMPLHSTGGHGRGDQRGSIIGDVINHGKKHLWGVKGQHYHVGMVAGENTLNALCARVAVRSVTAEQGRYSKARWLADYVAFMTTPGSHNDAYAESYHRDFFGNWAKGVAPEQCAGEEGHDTPSIGGFVTMPPVAIAEFVANGRPAALAAARQHLLTTHKSDALTAFADVYVAALLDVLDGKALQPTVEAAAKRLGPRAFDVAALSAKNRPDTDVVGGVFSTACYITGSLPSVFYLAHKHGASFERAVLANTNCGGENCHRGSALGALVGAVHGESGIPPRLIAGLAAREAIGKEIDAYVAALGL